MHCETDRRIASPRVPVMKQRVGGYIRNLLWGALFIAAMLFIFGPVLGLRETGREIRSRQIGEEQERRIRETLEYSERERRRSEEDLKRYQKEIFGNR